jgi:hypothetical protein
MCWIAIQSLLNYHPMAKGVCLHDLHDSSNLHHDVSNLSSPLTQNTKLATLVHPATKQDAIEEGF